MLKDQIHCKLYLLYLFSYACCLSLKSTSWPLLRSLCRVPWNSWSGVQPNLPWHGQLWSDVLRERLWHLPRQQDDQVRVQIPLVLCCALPGLPRSGGHSHLQSAEERWLDFPDMTHGLLMLRTTAFALPGPCRECIRGPFTFMPVLPLLFIAQKLLKKLYKPCSIYFAFLHDSVAAELSLHKLMHLWKDVLMPRLFQPCNSPPESLWKFIPAIRNSRTYKIGHFYKITTTNCMGWACSSIFWRILGRSPLSPGYRMDQEFEPLVGNFPTKENLWLDRWKTLLEGCLFIPGGLEFPVRWPPEAIISTLWLPVGQELVHGLRQRKLQEMYSATTVWWTIRVKANVLVKCLWKPALKAFKK